MLSTVDYFSKTPHRKLTEYMSPPTANMSTSKTADY